jgi:hypothetical protein
VAKPLTDDQRQEVIDLLPTGKSCNEIARLTGRGTSTVSRIARDVGHEWAQTNTERAREARSGYCAERRAAIAARLVDEANLLLDQLHQPHTAFNFGGKDNTYEEHELEEPPIEGKRALVSATRDAMRTVLDIARLDEKADTGRGRSLLEQLVDLAETVATDG